MKAENDHTLSIHLDQDDCNQNNASEMLTPRGNEHRRRLVSTQRRTHSHPHRVFLLISSFILLLSGCRCRSSHSGSHTTSEALVTTDFSPFTSSRTNRPFIKFGRNDESKFGIIPRGGSTDRSSSTQRGVSSKQSMQAMHEGAAEDDLKKNGKSFQKAPIKTEKAISNSRRSLVPPNASVNPVFLPLEDDAVQETEDAIKGREADFVECDYIAETNLPTDVGHFRLRAYRVSDDEVLSRFKHFGAEPCVIYSSDKPPFADNGGKGSIGEGLFSGKNVPVRIHDQCFTSEVFRSQRCDCKEQLKMSLEYVQKHGGCIIYLQQEGRGIGIANKIAAYAMQDVGFDTVDANTHLGFPEDGRMYGVVPSILADMGIESIRLITNNPRKVNRLTNLGVNVEDTIPMVVAKPTKYNRKYLQTKKDRMNHANFGEMLSATSIFSPKKIPDDYEFSQTISVAEDRINDGEEMAANAVVMALFDDEDEAGVTANGDGYCFGRKSVEDAIAAVGRGEIVVVVDDMDRENEGDFIMAADLATPETIATIVKYSSGVICIGMEGELMDELELPSMVTNNEDPKGTAFSVTVDASSKHGITTGISAGDRSKTLNLLASKDSTALDFCRPGHIFPLRAREGGVLTRDGHTEAAVDFSRLAGRHPSGVLCEIVSEENPSEMARLPELKRFCKKHGFVLTSIVDLAQYRRDTEEN